MRNNLQANELSYHKLSYNNSDKYNSYNNNNNNNNSNNKVMFNSNDNRGNGNNNNNSNDNNNPRTGKQRKRNIVWFNPPFSKNVATKIGSIFLS